MDPVARLADHSAQFPSSAISKTTRDSAHALLIDTIGCIFAGTNVEGMSGLLRAVERFGGDGPARVIGQNRYASPEDAAFLNAIACHSTDCDDTHDLSILHGCSVVVPALIALCDAIGTVEGSLAKRTQAGFASAAGLLPPISTKAIML